MAGWRLGLGRVCDKMSVAELINADRVVRGGFIVKQEDPPQNGFIPIHEVLDE